jgi:hypothetical protein
VGVPNVSKAQIGCDREEGDQGGCGWPTLGHRLVRQSRLRPSAFCLLKSFGHALDEVHTCRCWNFGCGLIGSYMYAGLLASASKRSNVRVWPTTNNIEWACRSCRGRTTSGKELNTSNNQAFNADMQDFYEPIGALVAYSGKMPPSREQEG